MPDKAFWQGRRVFVTGHTGFMGGWLCTLLAGYGARVTGYALDAAEPSFFRATGVAALLEASIIADIRDRGGLAAAVAAASPTVVFHLAAQPLVRFARANAHLTYETNIMGTVNLLEAVQQVPGVEAVLVVTTDKVYRNDGGAQPHRESDTLGGHEPYSASKAAAEFVLDAYRADFLGRGRLGLAAIRAGNIIGGGDWAADRLVPDAMRAFAERQPLVLRNPQSTRPWQHVLDPLTGYLQLAERLCAEPARYSSAWNFGPAVADCRDVGTVAALLAEAWGDGARFEVRPGDGVFEERLLALDSSKAMQELGWAARSGLEAGIRRTVEWYRAFHAGHDVARITREQVAEIAGGDA